MRIELACMGLGLKELHFDVDGGPELILDKWKLVVDIPFFTL